MIEPTVAAYLAGVIDSDGFISAHRKKYRGAIYCAPLIGISGTSPEPHELAKSTWGGSLFSYTPKNPRHRLQFQWQAVGKAAAIAVRDIRDHIRSKGRQADLVIEMWSIIDGGLARTDPALLMLAVQLSELNLRNPPRKQMSGRRPIPDDLLVRQFPPGATR